MREHTSRHQEASQNHFCSPNLMRIIPSIWIFGKNRSNISNFSFTFCLLYHEESGKKIKKRNSDDLIKLQKVQNNFFVSISEKYRFCSDFE